MNTELGIAVALLLLVLLLRAKRNRVATNGRPARALDSLDTVQSWVPEATRVLTLHERKAYDTLKLALPDRMVLAQVPLSRFIKVPRRHSYGEWLRRAGQLNADLVVCDRNSQVEAVVEVHSPDDSARSKERHERMARVLKAAGVRCFAWMESAIPTVDATRQLFGVAAAEAVPIVDAPPAAAAPARREWVEPEPEEFDGPVREPIPSTWFDDFDSAPVPLAGALSPAALAQTPGR